MFLVSAVTAVALSVATYLYGDQVPFLGNVSNHGTKVILTPELTKFIQEVVTNGSLPGLSIGIVHSGGVVEFGTWGKKSEDGEKMTSDVSLCLCDLPPAHVSCLVLSTDII